MSGKHKCHSKSKSSPAKKAKVTKKPKTIDSDDVAKKQTFDSDAAAKKHKTYEHAVCSFNSVIIESPTMQKDPEDPEASEDEIQVCYEGLGSPTMQEDPEDPEAFEDEYHTYSNLFGSPTDGKDPEASEDEIHVCSEELGSSNIQNNYDCLQLHLTPKTFFYAPPPDPPASDDKRPICVKCLMPISDEPDDVISEEAEGWYSFYTSVKNSYQPLFPKDDSVLRVMELPIGVTHRQEVQGPPNLFGSPTDGKDPEASKDEIHVCSEGLGLSNNQKNVLLKEVPCSNAMPLRSNHNDSIRAEIPLYKIKIDHLLKARSEHHSSKDVVFMPKKISDVKK